MDERGANDAIFARLNPEQRRAVEATRGPVCILAGAGSGKTTTITRRIAHQVAGGAFAPDEILAVTFTERAAGEMRARLASLGVEGVRARTFHSCAYQQLKYLSAQNPGNILSSKALMLRQIANTLPVPYKFRPAADLAQEVEWAKNRRIGVRDYRASLGPHEPPIPVDLMASVYERYERAKAKTGQIDFEDLLELAIRMFRNDEYARERFAARYKAFTVDEYQDVNLLQQTLLDEWLADGDDLCVVGDDYQSIYGFTGASPEYLLAMPGRFPNTNVIRLETNYRSTPEVLDVANRLVPKLGGAEKVLRASESRGTKPTIKAFTTTDAELRFVVERVRTLHKDEAIPLEEIAILYRVNFRSEDYEEVLAAAGIPYQVADGAFLTRTTGRQMLAVLKRSTTSNVAHEVRTIATRAGYVEEPTDDLGEQELTRQKDLARFVQLAEEFDDGMRSMADFAADLRQRFAGAGQGRGVHLLTLHGAKGLEFAAVLLPRVEEGELPFKRAKTDGAIAEERRLFYVGITRAKRHLAITWVNDGKRKASRFVGEVRPRATAVGATRTPTPARARDVLVAELDLSVKLAGGYTGRIIEIANDGVTVELANGVEMSVAYGEAVTNRGKTLPLASPALTGS